MNVVQHSIELKLKADVNEKEKEKKSEKWKIMGDDMIHPKNKKSKSKSYGWKMVTIYNSLLLFYYC